MSLVSFSGSICPARSLETFRLDAAWRAALESKRLLLLSAFYGKALPRRLLGWRRRAGEFVAALADTVLIAYAQPSSKTEAFARQLLLLE